MNKNTIGTIAIVGALVALLAMPVLAEAGRGNAPVDRKTKGSVAAARSESRAAAKAAKRAKRASHASGTARAIASTNASASANARASAKAKARAERKAQIEKRVANRLNARKHRFDAASANLNKRITRIASLAAKVAAAGGDVSVVNAKLDTARQHLASAKALELEAVAKFQAIASATDRKAAFAEARAKARQAVAELKLTRVSIREAAVTLRTVVKGLESKPAPGTVDAQ